MDPKGGNKLPPPSRPPSSAYGSGAHRSSHPAPPRSRSVRYLCRYELAAPESRLRRRQPACKEIVRRALTPPCQKLSGRWRNFRPTPSRFASVSVA
ncbi:Unknown protein [Striga hermonthica]|uniref:Uncharacterized protein n=1 Tax=Striga hermonthica TaxID=68872 RepID=A0A9N7MNM0_STRHE|nr:Unknown protein [Striga hermonthica]